MSGCVWSSIIWQNSPIWLIVKVWKTVSTPSSKVSRDIKAIIVDLPWNYLYYYTPRITAPRGFGWRR
jgi:hypothetical protein